MKFKHVFSIGVGGTGSHLVGPLVQLLRYHPDGTNEITLIDGDKYEDSNLTRQVCGEDDLGRNKAEVTAERFRLETIRVITEYVDQNKFSIILEKTVDKNDSILVITAVDNHATRNAVINSLDDGEYTDFVMISPGNQYSSGQIVLYVKEDGEPLTTHPFDKYEEIADPADVIPGEGGCSQEVASTPQLITANMGAAWAALSTVSNILDEKGFFEEVHFNCRRVKMIPQGTPKGILI